MKSAISPEERIEWLGESIRRSRRCRAGLGRIVGELREAAAPYRLVSGGSEAISAAEAADAISRAVDRLLEAREALGRLSAETKALLDPLLNAIREDEAIQRRERETEYRAMKWDPKQ